MNNDSKDHYKNNKSTLNIIFSKIVLLEISEKLIFGCHKVYNESSLQIINNITNKWKQHYVLHTFCCNLCLEYTYRNEDCSVCTGTIAAAPVYKYRLCCPLSGL